MSIASCAALATRPAVSPARLPRVTLAMALAVVGITSLSTVRADQVKTNDSNPLNLGSSWVGGIVPGGSEFAVFDNTITGAINPTLGDSSQIWGGIKVLNPGGAVSITDGSNTLTLQSLGIDMSAATQNLTLNTTVSTIVSQTWNVGAGRTLNIAGTLNYGAATVGTVSINKTGTGTLNLSANTLLGGSTSFLAGTTVLTGALATPVLGTANSVITVGSANTAGPAILIIGTGGNISAQATAGASIGVGSAAGSIGVIRMTDGNIITGASQFNLGAGQGGYGAFSMSGGVVTLNRYMILGQANDRAVFNMSGGTFNQNVNSLSIGSGTASSMAVANISGGVFNGTLGNPGGIIVGEFGFGVLNVTANANISISGTGTGNGSAGLNIGKSAGAVGIANLNGGTLTTNRIWSQTASTTSILNFNGGLLLAGNTPMATFLTGLDSANVYSGGARIDDGGNAITISQGLIAPAGQGVTGVTFTGSGTGFSDTPIIRISGGGGTGATAVAVLDANGTMTGITVTNPGINYTTAPTVDVLVNGLVNSPSAGTTTASFAPNVTTGGLTKSGGGTLTLSGVSSYGGPTAITQGRLRLTGSLTGTGAVSVANGATLEGNGSIAGAITINGGGALTPGSAGLGTLTTSGAVTLASGSTLNFEFTGAGTTDLVNMTGGGLLTIGSGVNLNIFTTGGNTSFNLPGTYTLFSTNGAVSGAPSNITVQNPVAGYTYSFASTGTGITVTIGGGAVWANAAGGSWGTAGNWSPAVVPGGVGSLVSLGSNPPGLASAGTITLDGARTLGTLLVNSTVSYTLSNSVLTLDNGTSVAGSSILVAAGSHTINSDISLANAINTFTVTSAASVLTVKNVSGSDLTTAGAGTVRITGALTSANLILGAGSTVQIGDGTAVGSFSGAVTLPGTSNLSFNRPDVVTLTNTINGTGTITQAGSGTLILNGNNTGSATAVLAGIVQVASPTAVGNGAMAVNGVLDINNQTLTVGALSGTGTITNTAGGSPVFTASQGGASTFSGVLQNGTGVTSLVKRGGGNLTLNGTSTYSGSTSIFAGVLTLASNTAIPTANDININNAGGLGLGNGVSIGNHIILNGSIQAGEFVTVAAGSATLSGPVTVADPTVANMQYRLGTASSLTITGTHTIPATYTNDVPNGTNLTTTIITILTRGTITFAQNAVLDSGVNIWIGRTNGATPVVNLIDNAKFISRVASGAEGANLGGNGSATTTSVNFTMSGNSIFQVGQNSDGLFNLSAGPNAMVGTANFSGGLLSLASFTKVGTGAVRVNFNGTQIKLFADSPTLFAANTSTANATGLTLAIQGGGAKFDLNGHSTFIHQALTGTADGGLALTATTGAGAMTLTGANSYQGPTSLATGVQLTFGSGTSNAANAIGLISGTGNVRVAPGTTLASDQVAANALQIDGAHTIRANGTNVTTSVVGTLAIAGVTGAWTGKMEINNHVVIVNTANGTASKASVIAALNDQVKQGATGTANGITSATVLADTTHKATYVVDNALLGLTTTIEGVAVNAASVIVEATYQGDANLDRKVNVTDLGVLATFYGQNVTGYGIVRGDFDGNGIVNVSDLGILATDYGLGTAPGSTFSLQADLAQFPTLAGAAAAVPEPASLAVLAVGAGALLTRRKRR